MESMEKPLQHQNTSQQQTQENTSPANCDKPYTTIQLSNFGGPYSKMTSSESGREIKAEPSSTRPGYIEVRQKANHRVAMVLKQK